MNWTATIIVVVFIVLQVIFVLVRDTILNKRIDALQKEIKRLRLTIGISQNEH